MSEQQEISFSFTWGKVQGVAWGDPKNPPVLAVHGWLDNCLSFYFLGPSIASAYVVAVDLPIHRLSDHLADGLLSFHDMEFVSALHRIVSQLGWRQGFKCTG